MPFVREPTRVISFVLVTVQIGIISFVKVSTTKVSVLSNNVCVCVLHVLVCDMKFYCIILFVIFCLIKLTLRWNVNCDVCHKITENISQCQFLLKVQSLDICYF